MDDRARPRGGTRALWHGLVADPKHGPLPAFLLGLTLVTGVVDSVSILALGRVFVANMTGNIVFIGFAIAGAPGFSLAASLFALVGFMFGALGGGLAIDRLGNNRAVLFRNVVGTESLLLVAALTVSVLAARPFAGPTKDAIAAITATALGLQNSVARRLAVPDLTTTVLTMTLTGLAADIRSRGRAVVERRLLAVGTMLTGAVAGALLVLHDSASVALGLAAGLLIAVTVATATAGRRPAGWNS